MRPSGRSRLAALAVFVLALTISRGTDVPEERPGSLAAWAPTGAPAPGGSPGSIGPAAAHPVGAAPSVAGGGRSAAAIERAMAALRAAGGPAALARRQRSRDVDLAQAAGIAVPVAAPVEVAGTRHTTLDLRKHGLPIWNRRVKRHVGAVAGASGDLRIPPLEAGFAGLSRERAIDRALEATGVRALRAAPIAERGWFALAARTVAAWRVVLPSAQPFASFQVIIAVRSGEILASADRMLAAQGSGSVYLPNVEQSGGLPSTQPLFDLDDSGFLAGRIARVIDERAVEAFRPDLSFVFPPADPRFVQTSVYRALTDTARLAESQGFPAFPEPLHAFTNLAGEGGVGEFNNAFYDPLFGLFFFGNGDGVELANVGTDSDVAAHEMGHHLFQTLAQPLIMFTSDLALAMHEGTADFVAAIENGDPEIAESLVPGQPYLRTLVNVPPRVFPDDVAADPHETGLIFGGFLWDLAQEPPSGVGPVEAGQILMAGLPFLPARPLAWELPEALVLGDQAVNGGVNVATINALALDRGLDDTDPPELQGEVLEGQPQSRGLANGAFHYWLFFEFPGSTSVTFATTGTGDADLYVAPLALALNEEDYLASTGPTSVESVTFTAPEVDADDVYLVLVEDFAPDLGSSSYTLSVTSVLPPAQITIPGVEPDSLETVDELDLFIVNGVAGDVMRVEVDALTPGLDLVAVVFDPKSSDFLGGDDDSGPGVDPLIQGARFPTTRPYALAVFSQIGDLDPGTGVGDYVITLSQCTNTGTNTDGDLLVDACDDNDDNDEFIDSQDAAPLDPTLCADVDADTCDDCSSGPFDPFTDGPDFDGDAVCDAGDVDRDNDGCENPDDPAPLATSVDADLDFLGADCDNCPALANPTQDDGDADARGDGCDNCLGAANFDQADTGGFASLLPDGNGNACQYAEVSGDGNVSVLDSVRIARFLNGLGPPLVAPERCPVALGAACNLANWSNLRLALAGLLAVGPDGAVVIP